MQTNNLRVLGITTACTDPKAIKAAYNRLALKHHPDKGGDPAMFRLVKSAYDSLMRVYGNAADADTNMQREEVRAAERRQREEVRAAERRQRRQREEVLAAERRQREEVRAAESRQREELWKLDKEFSNASKRAFESHKRNTQKENEDRFFFVMDDGETRGCLYLHEFMKCRDVKISINVNPEKMPRRIEVRYGGATHVVSDEIPLSMPSADGRETTKYPKSHPWLKEVRSSRRASWCVVVRLDIIIKADHPPIVAFREHLDAALRTSHIAYLEAVIDECDVSAKIDKATARGVRALMAMAMAQADEANEARANELEHKSYYRAVNAEKYRAELRTLHAAPLGGLWSMKAVRKLLDGSGHGDPTIPPSPDQVSQEVEIMLAKRYLEWTQ